MLRRLAAFGPHPQVSIGLGVEPARGDGPPFLVVSFLVFHFRVPLGKIR